MKLFKYILAVVLCLVPAMAQAQTKINKDQIPATTVYTDQNETFGAHTYDFSGVSVFRPKFGVTASLPAACTLGDVYESTNATAGQNWYFCTATNTWTQQLNSGANPVNPYFQGPNIVIDFTSSLYNGRAVASSSIPSTTVTTTASSTSATLAAASTFQNNDGVMIVGAGATNTMSTPAAPTINPSEAAGGMGTGVVASAAGAGGATLYQYQIAARDLNGGITAASAVGSTNIGATTLGATQYTITTLTRANNVVTATTSATHTIVPGAVVYVANSTDATFSGYFIVASTPTGTTFTYSQGMDTRAGATTSATGGTAQIYACNHLTWAAVTGAFQYYIYRGSSLIGVSRPGELQFDDFGSPAMNGITLPSYVSSTPPASATNDNFSTTIASGAGTTSITLAAAPTQSVSGATIVFDAGPALLSAANAATTAGTAGLLRIPTPASLGGSPVYPINYPIALPDDLTIWQSGPLLLNETVQLGSGTTWIGDMGGEYGSFPSFGWNLGQLVNVNAANPGVYIGCCGGNVLRGLSFNIKNQGLGLIISGAGIGGGGIFNTSIDQSNFSVGSGNADYMGMGIVGYGLVNTIIRRTSFITSDPAAFGSSLTPLLFLRNDTSGVNGTDALSLDHDFFTGRGVVIDSTPSAGGQLQFDYTDTYSQAMRMPLFAFTGIPSRIVKIQVARLDTTTAGVLANWGANLNGSEVDFVSSTSGEVGGLPGLVTGNVIPGLQSVSLGGVPLGQNTQVKIDTVASMTLPIYNSPRSPTQVSDFIVAGPLHIPSQNNVYIDLPMPANVAASVSSGGSVPVGANTYTVTALDGKGGETKASMPTTCTTTSGNQTCVITWTAVAGASSYNAYRNGFGTADCIGVLVATCSQASSSAGNGTPPGDTSAVLASLSPSAVAAPSLILSSALNGGAVSFMGTLTPGVLTANRTYTFPDATGTVCLTSTCGGQFYQTLQDGGVSATQRPKFNFIAGTNQTITCVDNPGNLSTDCTFIASSSASTQWASLTASVLSVSGTFTSTGNTWNFSGATAFTGPTSGIVFPGSSSGSVTLVAQSTAGSPTVTFGTSSGTPAVTASSPLAITTATGNITCATCVTASGGGALAGNAPITVSGSTVSISGATTGALGSIELAGNLGGTSTSPTVVSTTISGATNNYIPVFSSGNLINSTATDTGSLWSFGDVVDLTSQPLVQEIANAASTGTTIHKFASLTGAPAAAVITSAGATGAIGIVTGGAGTSSNAQITLVGQTTCVFDGGTTAGDFVTQSSSVAGDCTDNGSTAPTGMPTIYVLSTNASAGTYAVSIVGGGGGGGSGSGTVNSGTASQLAYYAGSGTAVSGAADATISTGTLTLGASAAASGIVRLYGSTSGLVTLDTANAAGTYTWQFPTSLGTSGYVLTSGTPLTWTSPSITIVGQTCTLGSTCKTSETQINTADIGNQNLTNFITSTGNTIGLTATPSNPNGAANVKFEITGITTPTGGGTGISNPASHSLLIAENSAVMNTLISPSTNGQYGVVFNVTSSAAADPTAGLPGVPVLTPSSGYTGLYSDRGTLQRLAGGSTFTWNAPQITGNTGFNFPVAFANNNSGTLSFIANAADKVNGGSTGGTYSIFSNYFALMYQDSSSAPGNWWPVQIPQIGAFVNTGANSAETFNSATGAWGALTNIVNCSPARAGDVAIWSGSAWTCLAGNNSGTNFLQETSTGSASWASVSGSGTVTSVATTSPITGGTFTTSGTIACATCVTSAAALTQYGVVIGGGLQASSTIAASTTTTQALFATATAPAFRAITAADLPGVPINGVISATGAITAIADGNNPLAINCAQTSNNQSCVSFGETSAATGGTAGNQFGLKISTAAGSTASALGITSSLTGSQTLASLYIQPVWNTTGVVDAGILENVNNTASGTASKLMDLQVGGTSEFNVDKAGNGIFAATIQGTILTLTSGQFNLTETTAPSASAGSDICYGDSSLHAVKCAFNNGSFEGLMLESTTSTTTTNAVFASSTAGVYTPRAIAGADIGGLVSFDKSSTGLINPTADATFTYGSTSTTGLTISGTAPASVSTSTGTNASSIFNVSGVAGGADSNATGTGGVGSSPTIAAGTGGAGTGTNAVGGAGGSWSVTTGNGGASSGTGANANGGGVTYTLGKAGIGGSGTAGTTGEFLIQGTAIASTASSAGLSAGTLFSISGLTGGATSNATGTAGVGSIVGINSGTGGAGTGTNAVGGAGGAINITAGNGGASNGTGNNSNGGKIILTPGAAGTGGSGTAGTAGVVEVAGSLQVSSTATSCVPGTAGAECFTEGTAVTGASSVDDLYANSTGHCIDAINNNTDVGCLAGLAGVQTFTAAQTFSGGIINTTTPIRDQTRFVLAANMTTVDTAGVNIGSTGAGNSTFSWPVTSANWYDLTCKLPVTFVASATISFELVSISGSVTVSYVNSETMGNTGAVVAFQDLTTIAGTTLAGSATPTTGAPGGVSETISLNFQFLTSHAGNIGVEFIGNGANNVTMLKGGECGITQIN